MSACKIIVWDTTIGYLYWDKQKNTSVFEADEAYCKAPFNISPVLHPIKEESLVGFDFHEKWNGLIPCFSDSLPDSFGNIVFKEWLNQNNIDSALLNPVDRLLYTGNQGMGALEYYPSKKLISSDTVVNLDELASLSDQIIQHTYNRTDFLKNPAILQTMLSIGSSVGGAQAKVLVAINAEGKMMAGDSLYKTPVDYYIVKLEHNSVDLWQREKNKVEYVYNQIAQDIGIHVAPSKLIHHNNKTHFASMRFDRIDQQKIHTQTVHALTGFYGKNYEFSYIDIFKIIQHLGLGYVYMEQLFMQMVFNVAASNRDDHTKNFSFTMNAQGSWSLSPAYDLTFPYDPYQSFDIQHKIQINGKTKNIHRSDLEAVARKVGIRNYQQIIDRVLEQLSTFSDRIKLLDVHQKTIELILRDLEKNRIYLK